MARCPKALPAQDQQAEAAERQGPQEPGTAARGQKEGRPVTIRASGLAPKERPVAQQAEAEEEAEWAGPEA